MFYVREMGEPNWYVVQRLQPRDFYDMDTYKVTSDDPFQNNDLSNIGQCSTQDVDLNDCVFSCHRSDIPLEISFEAGTSRQWRKRMYHLVMGKKMTRGRGEKNKFEMMIIDCICIACLVLVCIFFFSFLFLYFSKA